MEEKLRHIILGILYIVTFLLSFIFTCKIIHNSSSNPFDDEKKYNNYFDFLEPISFEYCFCEKVNHTSLCPQYLLKIGCKDVISDYPLMIENKYDCNILQYEIKNKSQPLKKLFNTKIKVPGETVGHLVIKSFSLVLVIILVGCIHTSDTDSDGCNQCIAGLCGYIFYILAIIFFIIEIILFSVSSSKCKKNDNEKFLKFLECPNVFIFKEGFTIYNSIETYDSNIIEYMLFSIIHIVYFFIYFGIETYLRFKSEKNNNYNRLNY